MTQRNSNSFQPVLILCAAGGFLFFIRQQLGDVAALCFFFYFAGVATCFVAMLMGGQMHGKGQETFFVGLAKLKSIAAPVVREAARTEGARERAEINLQYRQAASHKPPSEQEIELENWARRYDYPYQQPPYEHH